MTHDARADATWRAMALVNVFFGIAGVLLREPWLIAGPAGLTLAHAIVFEFLLCLQGSPPHQNCGECPRQALQASAHKYGAEQTQGCPKETGVPVIAGNCCPTWAECVRADEGALKRMVDPLPHPKDEDPGSEKPNTGVDASNHRDGQCHPAQRGTDSHQHLVPLVERQTLKGQLLPHHTLPLFANPPDQTHEATFPASRQPRRPR